jgi:hypothetical protein
MAKDWNRRLSDTVTVVKTTAPAGFAGDRHLVITALEKWLLDTPVDRKKRVSELMSQEGAPSRPSQGTNRALRRASILLQCALISPDPAQWPEKQSLVNSTKADFTAAMYKQTLSDAYDSVCSGELGWANLGYFLTSPKEFLEKYKVIVSGRNDSAAYEYGFAMENGTYKISAGNPHQKTTKLYAINVPAVLFNTVEHSLDAITGTRSADHTECSVMLTTQFTGCTYCFMLSPDGTSLVAAHIDPGGGMGRNSNHTGQSISKALREGGGFRNGNGGVFRAYGRVSDPGQFGYPATASQMIITAVKRDGRWQIFAQIAEDNGFRVQRIENLPA